jgi:hypothetical protein
LWNVQSRRIVLGLRCRPVRLGCTGVGCPVRQDQPICPSADRSPLC